ncbi:MAG: hypothetical protein JNL82_31120 [Myxococcales bacterium]|nr:hypothetical protein [Myxococcales bacterium]
MTVRGAGALAVLAGAVYLLTAPGRIEFPDDEVVFQTAVSLWEDGDLMIAGIPKRTGEPKGRPDGTFGVADVDGRRYGFFGHGLSLVALPLVAIAEVTAPAVPPTWAHAVRSDHYVFHRREPRADWLRLVVSLVNCVVTAATVGLLALWLRALGFAERTALVTAGAFALATSAWAYSRTMLSEPLSGLCVVAAAYCVTRWRGAGSRWLWLAGAIVGFSLHVHALNVTLLPCAIGLALAYGRGDRRGWIGAAGLLALAAGLLLLGQWWRFGDPLETGRFGHYSWFVWPWEGLAGLLVGPGRSFWLYSPAAALGLLGWAALRRRGAVVWWFAVGTMLLRWLVISTRSDWYGGWGLGARHLVPVIPLAMLGFAAALEDVVPGWARWRRVCWWIGVGLAVGLSGWFGVHSIFEWMARLMMRMDGSGYIAASHWSPSASPVVGFAGQPVDMLSVGAIKLARVGVWGPALGFVVVGGVGAGALVAVVRALRR